MSLAMTFYTVFQSTQSAISEKKKKKTYSVQTVSFVHK